MNPPTTLLTKISGITIAALAALATLPSAYAANGTWAVDADGSWSTATNWTPNSTLVGNTAGDTVGLSANVTVNRVATLDRAVLLGTLNLGDTNATHTYTLAQGTGTLAFDNGASAAQLNQLSTSKGDTISAGFSLNSALTINNAASANALGLSGIIADGVNGAKSVTITGASTASRINASGANTFTGGLFINSGYYYGQTSTSAFGGSGTGAVTLGDTSGTASALLRGGSLTFANPITVRSGTTSNTLTIMGAGGGGTTTFSGGVTLNKDVTLDSSKGILQFSTVGISGSNLLTITNSDATSVLSTNYVNLNVANASFTGNVDVNNAKATLRVSNASALSSANTVKVSSGLFELAATQTIAGINDNAGTGGTVSVVTSSQALTVGGTGSYSFNGTLQDNGASLLSLTKSGTGTQALGGTNTYTGTTTINGGVLRLNSANALSGGIGATGGTGALLFSGGGVIGLTASSGNFSRSLVGLTPGAGQVGWTNGGSGGFAAFGGDRTVNFGGAAGSVTWSSTGGVLGASLILGDATADSKVTVVNPLNFNTGTRTVIVNNGSAAVDGELSGGITGGGTLVKQGTGTLELSGSGSAGTVTISAGTLRVSNAAALNSNAITVQLASGAALDLNANSQIGGLNDVSGAGGTVSAIGASRALTLAMTTGNNYSFSGVLQDSGANVLSLTKSGGGTQTLSGASTFTGTSTIRNGTVVVGVSDVASTSGAFGNASSNILLTDASSAASDNVSLLISGAFTLNRNITVQNNATSGTTSIGSNSNSTSIFGGNITLNKGVTLVSNVTAGQANFTGAIGGTGDIRVTGTGTGQVRLTGTVANTYNGTVFVDSGTLRLNGTNSGLNAITGNLQIANGAILQSANQNQIVDTATITNNGTWTINSGTNETIGALVMSGSAASVTTSSISILTLGSASVATDVLTMTGGNISIGASAGNTGFLRLNGNVSVASSANVASISSISTLASTLNLSNLGAATRTFNVATGTGAALGNELTISASIVDGNGGAGGILKSGTGTMTLSGANTFTGATTVNTGTLLIAPGGSISNTSKITVASGATIQNNNGAAITRALTLTEGSTLITNASGSSFTTTNGLELVGDLSNGWTAIALTNTLGSGLIKDGALTFTLTGITAGTYDLDGSSTGFTGLFSSAIVGASALTTADSGATFTGTNIGGFDYSFTNSTNTLTIAATAVPEPSTWMGAGLITSLVAWSQRKRFAKIGQRAA